MRLAPYQHSKGAWELTRQSVAAKADPDKAQRLARFAENRRIVVNLGRVQEATKGALDKAQQQAARM